MRKKVLSGLLALAMALSMLPGVALSEELEPAEDTAPSDEAQIEIIAPSDEAQAEIPAHEEAPVEDNVLFAEKEVEIAAAGGEEPVRLRITPPTTQTVTQGSAMDIRGLVVYAVYADGSEQAVTDYSLSGLDTSQTGERAVTVTYGTLTATFPVTVEAAPEEDYIAGIAVIGKPKKRVYTQGQSLDEDDINSMSILVAYHLGKREMVRGDKCTVTGYNSNQLGVQTLTVSYGGKSAEVLVRVVPGNGQSMPDNVPVLMAPRMSIESVQGGKTVRFTRTGNDDTDTTYHPANTAGAMAKIYYTLDGSVPSSDSIEYDGGDIFIEETTTVKAIAILGEEKSNVSGGRVSVPQVAAPKPANEHHKNNQGPDGGVTQLQPGTLVSFLCDTAGASVYYWFDGQSANAEDHRYGTSVYIDRAYADANDVVTLNAYAVKDGYKNSNTMRLMYQLPHEEPPREELVNISVGTARSRAGENVSASLSITTEESSCVTGFTITVRYDRRTFRFESVSPAETGGAQSEAVIPAGDLFAAPDTANGLVRIMYNGAPVIGGEMCMLNFSVYDSAENSDNGAPYELTVDGESARVSTNTGRPVREETYNGSIALEGSHNSQLAAAVVFSDERNRDASNVRELSDSSNVTASISIDQESVQDYASSLPRDEAGNPPLTVVASVFVAFYDEHGDMLDLETWEIDLSDLARLLFDRMMAMPGETYDIKTMILSESLTPIMAAEEL